MCFMVEFRRLFTNTQPIKPDDVRASEESFREAGLFTPNLVGYRDSYLEKLTGKMLALT